MNVMRTVLPVMRPAARWACPYDFLHGRAHFSDPADLVMCVIKFEGSALRRGRALYPPALPGGAAYRAAQSNSAVAEFDMFGAEIGQARFRMAAPTKANVFCRPLNLVDARLPEGPTGTLNKIVAAVFSAGSPRTRLDMSGDCGTS